MAFLKALCSMLVLVAVCECFKEGAPTDACKDLTPQHGEVPKPLPSPYTLTITKKANKKVSVTIGSANNLKFKGYLLQARDTKGDPIGVFESGSNIKLISCGVGHNNTATHSDASEKSRVSVTWKAPANLVNPVEFYLTTAKNGGEYWVGQKSGPVTIS